MRTPRYRSHSVKAWTLIVVVVLVGASDGVWAVSAPCSQDPDAAGLTCNEFRYELNGPGMHNSASGSHFISLPWIIDDTDFFGPCPAGQTCQSGACSIAAGITCACADGAPCDGGFNDIVAHETMPCDDFETAIETKAGLAHDVCSGNLSTPCQFDSHCEPMNGVCVQVRLSKYDPLSSGFSRCACPGPDCFGVVEGGSYLFQVGDYVAGVCNQNGTTPCYSDGDCTLAGLHLDPSCNARVKFTIRGIEEAHEVVLLGPAHLSATLGRNVLRVPHSMLKHQQTFASRLIADMGGFVNTGGPVTSIQFYDTTTDNFFLSPFTGNPTFDFPLNERDAQTGPASRVDEPRQAYLIRMARDLAYTPEYVNRQCTVGGVPCELGLDCTLCVDDSDCTIPETCKHAGTCTDDGSPCLEQQDCRACALSPFGPCEFDEECPGGSNVCSGGFCNFEETSAYFRYSHLAATNPSATDITMAVQADDSLSIRGLNDGGKVLLANLTASAGTVVATRDGHADWIDLGRWTYAPPTRGGTSIQVAATYTDSTQPPPPGGARAGSRMRAVAAIQEPGVTVVDCGLTVADSPLCDPDGSFRYMIQPDFSVTTYGVDRIEYKAIGANPSMTHPCAVLPCRLRADRWPSSLAISEMHWSAPTQVKFPDGGGTVTGVDELHITPYSGGFAPAQRVSPTIDTCRADKSCSQPPHARCTEDSQCDPTLTRFSRCPGGDPSCVKPPPAAPSSFGGATPEPEMVLLDVFQEGRALVCGDGIVSDTVNGIEDCDDGNTSGGDSCPAACRFDSGLICGNNYRQGSEVCDGVDLAGENCQTRGFESGSLLCANNCQNFITSYCGHDTGITGDAIPTLPQWVIGFLALLVAASGTIILIRRPTLVGASGVSTPSQPDPALLFDPSIYGRVLFGLALLAFAAFALSTWIAGSWTLTDAVGIVVCLPVAAYLVHLWIVHLNHTR